MYFYYLNSGEEIARVEVPQWAAKNEELLALGHSMIVEQCKKGQGYPVAISEAHEQAVISGPDRQVFKQGFLYHFSQVLQFLDSAQYAQQLPGDGFLVVGACYLIVQVKVRGFSGEVGLVEEAGVGL